MTEFLVKRFVKQYEQTDRLEVRTAYGTLSSIVGIVCNSVLFLVKAVIGIALNSISVTADAFNNLSDAGSSIISLVGVKMAGKPADADHPFGHGRMEYICALVVSFLVMQVGFTFLKDSISKIRRPEQLTFQTLSVVVLILSVGVKLWLGYFNRKLGKRIHSQVMLAVSADAMGDVITTSATIVSLLVFWFTKVNIDGFVGLGVALVVLWAGIGIAKDTLEPLIGTAVTPETYMEITKFVEQYDGIVGSHDLIVHNYGPGRSMASIHAEVPNDVNIEVSHEIIDKIERDAIKTLGIFLVIHMDPVEMKNEHVLAVRKDVTDMLSALDKRASIHDFRMVEGEHQINLIFDMLIPHEYTKQQAERLQSQLKEVMKVKDPRYECVIVMEKGYIAEEE